MLIRSTLLLGSFSVFLFSTPCVSVEHVDRVAALHNLEQGEASTDVEKRSPKSFYAWNGKRNFEGNSDESEELERHHEIEEGKRGPPKSFYSWNGKRSQSENHPEISTGSEEGGMGKRAPKSFYAWNGKRSEQVDRMDSIEEDKRAPKSFYAWNGKRGKWRSPSFQMKFGHGKRAPKSFYAWNGKRAPKSFYAWNGKRAEQDMSAEYDEEPMVEGKRAPKSFYAWNGKRAPKSFYAWNGKRSPKSFYAWNGKRSEDLSDEEQNRERSQEEFEPIHQGKRAPKSFYAWNGKRSPTLEHTREGHENAAHLEDGEPHYRAKRSYAAVDPEGWEGPRFVPNHFYGIQGARPLNGDLMPPEQAPQYAEDPYQDRLNDVYLQGENEPKRKFYHFTSNQDPFDL